MNNNSIKNCPKIFNFDIPNDRKIAISFFLAFVHKSNNNETYKKNSHKQSREFFFISKLFYKSDIIDVNV